MTDRLHLRLHRLFESDDCLRKRPEDERWDEQVRDQNVVFETLRRTLLRPRMEILACFLRGRFVPTSITTDEKRYDASGRLLSTTGITLRAFVNASTNDTLHDTPHYAVYWEPLNRVARFYSNTNARHLAGEHRVDGKACLSELTSDLIEAKLLVFARAII